MIRTKMAWIGDPGAESGTMTLSLLSGKTVSIKTDSFLDAHHLHSLIVEDENAAATQERARIHRLFSALAESL